MTDDYGDDGRNRAFYEDEMSTRYEKIALLREALQAAQLQLEYLESRFPTGTTPPTLAKIERALRKTL